MEITYTQSQSFSMDLDAEATGELAAHLDITVRKLRKLVEDDDLMVEFGDQVTEWVGRNEDKAEVVHHDDIDIDEVIW